MISIAITVCNEVNELTTLLDSLQECALSPEYEIVIQIDQDNNNKEVIDLVASRNINYHFFPLNNDFATYKNNLIKYCNGETIFFIDADEVPSKYLIQTLPFIIESNPDVDMFFVPRINIVNGISEEHVKQWGWTMENNRQNFPDNQTRIVKNIPSIRWKNKLHERLEGYKKYSILPPQDEFCLLHIKTIEKQEKQNNFYSTL